MTKTIREALEKLAHESNNRGLVKLGESHTDIDQALASIREMVKIKKNIYTEDFHYPDKAWTLPKGIANAIRNAVVDEILELFK